MGVKVKKELKWSVLLLLMLFPLLAWVLLNDSANQFSDNIVVEQPKDTSIVVQDSLVMIDEDPEPAPEMMPDGRFPQNYFKSPVNYDAFIVGNFGELRSNHFHTGLDIRTGGIEGKEIFSSAAGYVSRINVSEYGYGNALYVTHPNGYTTVYAHLQRFSKDIQFYVRKHQYAKHSFEVELYPEKGLIQVQQGDLIAYSGNSGGSGGPHLHFEIRKTNTSEPVNPLLFGIPIADNLAPEILKLYIYQLDKAYREHEGIYPFTGINSTRNTLPGRKITIRLPQGKYAMGAYMKDYFRAHTDNLGVNYFGILADDKLIFDCQIDKIDFSTTRYINAHMDFCVSKTENLKAAKLFKDDGNRLDFYQFESDKGAFILKDSIALKIYAMDCTGRRDSLMVKVYADSTAKFTPTQLERKTKTSDICKVFTPGNSFALSAHNTRLTMPSNALYFNYKVCVQEMGNIKDGFSALWSFGESFVPIQSTSDIAIKIDREIPASLRSKLLIVELESGNKYPVGGRYRAGFVETSIRNFGSFYIDIDTIPPTIQTINIIQNQEFIFNLSDNLSGIESYNAYVDKRWLLMEFDRKTGLLKGKLQVPLDKGNHTFTLKVRDERGNEATFERRISIP